MNARMLCGYGPAGDSTDSGRRYRTASWRGADAVLAKANGGTDPGIPGGAGAARPHLRGGRGHRATPPAGYVVDHTRIKLGEGETVFAAAQGRPGAVGAVPARLGGGVARGHADPGRAGRGGAGPVPSACGG